eukprot:TRINITY_DN33705_c0_g1_i1.p1 TRINITY_DN33705_c0_g1~~TRINITY_DN33705_c0_g1_i1.p1  ORF type:complete len:111 (-),score=30.56 TRINITY_DN33705_c0_g1_i1:190-498(-)
MGTVNPEMQQYPHVSGFLVLLAVLHLNYVEANGLDDPSLTRSNMGIRIMKRGQTLRNAYRIRDSNHHRYPEILQILRRSPTSMSMDEAENWLDWWFVRSGLM